MNEPPRCCCVWAGRRCPNDATQEDGLCDWCGKRRAEDLANNPKLMRDPITGEPTMLGGAGEAHVDTTRTPDACWMPNSGALRVTTRWLGMGDGR